jgi:hypothetical protein
MHLGFSDNPAESAGYPGLVVQEFEAPQPPHANIGCVTLLGDMRHKVTH